MTEPERPLWPWELRARTGITQDTPVTRAYRAMRKMGLKPIKVSDETAPGRWVGTRMLFSCGCVRIYRAEQRTGAEHEWAEPCELHTNPLTSAGVLIHTPAMAGGKDRQEQQEHPDDRNR